MLEGNLMLSGIQSNENGLMDLQYFTQDVLGGREDSHWNLAMAGTFLWLLCSLLSTLQVLPLLVLLPWSHLPPVLLPSVPFPQLPCAWTSLASPGGLQVSSHPQYPSSVLGAARWAKRTGSHKALRHVPQGSLQPEGHLSHTVHGSCDQQRKQPSRLVVLWILYCKRQQYVCKTLLLCRKVPLVLGAVRKQYMSVHTNKFFRHVWTGQT